MSKQSTQNSKQPGGDAGAANAAAGTAAATAEDLELIPASLEDEVKSDEEIWEDIDTQETAAANGEDLAGDKSAVNASAAAASGGSVEDQLEAGIEAGKQTGEASSGQDDKGEHGTGDAQGAADKLWSNANDEQRAALDASHAHIKKLEQSERSNRGRVSTLQRQLNDITRQFDQRADKATADQPSDTDVTATNAFLDSKDWKDFEGEYPEVAGPLGKVVAGLQTEITGQRKQLDAIGVDRRQDAVDEQTDLLEEEHPDWLDAAEDPMFGGWLEDQPRHIREAAVRNAREIVDAAEAADVVGRFKAFRSEQSDDSAGPGDAGAKPDDQEQVTSLSGKRKRQLEASSGARPTGAAAAHGIPEEGDEEAIWDAFDKKEAREARQA